MEINNLLPIGTVVRVKESEKNMMIIGVIPEMEGVRYDYIAVLFPEGYLTEEQIYLFNHSDIEQVHYLGYMNIEYQEFRGSLNLILQEIAETDKNEQSND